MFSSCLPLPVTTWPRDTRMGRLGVRSADADTATQARTHARTHTYTHTHTHTHLLVLQVIPTTAQSLNVTHTHRLSSCSKHYVGHHGQQQQGQRHRYCARSTAKWTIDLQYYRRLTDKFLKKCTIQYSCVLYSWVPRYKIATSGALARTKVKLYYGKTPCGRYEAPRHILPGAQH